MIVRAGGKPQLGEMCWTCFWTVVSVTHNARAIPMFDFPSAIRANTSRSRSLSTASGSFLRRAFSSSMTNDGSTTEPPFMIRSSVSINSLTSVTRLLRRYPTRSQLANSSIASLIST